MKLHKLSLCLIMAAATLGGGLVSCQKAQSIAGTYKYIGWNGLIQKEEDWNLVVAADNKYTLSLTNDFISAENYGNVSKNADGTYLLKHTGSKDPTYPYPTIVYGFHAVDTAGTDWECTGKFDFDAKTFTPIVDDTATSVLPPLVSLPAGTSSVAA
jgi:hypothetical protein